MAAHVATRDPHMYGSSRMQPQLLTTPIDYELIGISCTHDPATPYSKDILVLLDRLWPMLKQHQVKHDGLNRVVYERGHRVFAGVKPEPAFLDTPGFERYHLKLGRHAYWKHVGPYSLIPKVCNEMQQHLAAMGLRMGVPMIEVYGHWTPDESKLVTETYVAVQ